MKRGVKLKLLPYAIYDGLKNMRIDTYLLEICESDPRCGFLRFYGWAHPTLSLGRFEKTEVIDVERAAEDGVDIVRRPTGGRVVLHGDDLTYAVVVPLRIGTSLQEIYAGISECLMRGLSLLGLDLTFEKGRLARTDLRIKPCFASAARYEITWQGKKLVGSAQRVGKQAVLQHGSIPIGRGYLKVIDYMRCDDRARLRLRKQMEKSTCCLKGIAPNEFTAAQVSSFILETFREVFDILQPISLEGKV